VSLNRRLFLQSAGAVAGTTLLPLDAPLAAIAWELAACDMGYPCGPMSRIVLTACAYRGYCDDYFYDDAIARDEGPVRMARAQRLRGDLVHALRRQDWNWLGLAG